MIRDYPQHPFNLCSNLFFNAPDVLIAEVLYPARRSRSLPSGSLPVCYTCNAVSDVMLLINRKPLVP